MSIVPKAESHETPMEVGVVDYVLPADTPADRSLAAMYVRLFPPLCASAARYIGREAARDVVQEAMLELIRRWPKLTPEERTDRLIKKAVCFRVIDEMRRNRRYVEYTPELEDAGIVPINSPTGDARIDPVPIVDRIIEAMPPQRRAVVLLVYEDGLTIREAAEVMRIDFETARTHMKLAHASLRKQMGPIMPWLRPGDGRKRLPPTTEGTRND